MSSLAEEGQSIDRRRFLRGAGAAALAALLSGCGARAGTSPSPFPGRVTYPALPTTTPSPSPTSSATATATGTPEDLFQSPLGTPSSPTPTGPFTSPLDEPTPLAPPTATPTPLPTPFPAGPPTKLGLFVAWVHPQVIELVATGNVALIKTLEFDPAFLGDIRARSPQTLIIGRVTLGQLDLNRSDMPALARSAADAVLPLALDSARAGLVDAWEGFNEPVPGNEDQMRKLADLEAERVRLLAQNGLRAVVGNFGAGQPPLEWWPAFRPALEMARAHDGYLGLHEYSAPTMWYNTTRSALDFGASPRDEGWLTLRYRKVYRQFLLPWGLPLPLLITECGVDGMVNQRPGPPGKGWHDFARYWAELGMGDDAAGNYIEQLAWYDSQLHHDDYVLGAAIFAMTAFQEWVTYEIKGEAAEVLKQYLSVHPRRQG